MDSLRTSVRFPFAPVPAGVTSVTLSHGLHCCAMSDSRDKPGQGIIEAALAARDTGLLRKIAAERKGLTEQQRQALTLVADLLDRAADKRGGHA